MARAKREGINPERAKKGFRDLYDFVTAIRSGGKHPPEGVLTLVLRTLYRYPEILAWDYQWRLALEEQGKATYTALKAVRNSIIVGRHLDHQNTSWDGLFASQFGYAEIAPHCDFIKPILYHDILGPRIRWWHLEELTSGPLADLPLSLAYNLFLSTRGYDPNTEPRLDELDSHGFSPAYVGKETRRIVDAVAGKCRVIAGIGIDVPDSIHHPKRRAKQKVMSEPKNARSAVIQALKAGAEGILVSREYDEMRIENLKAIGQGLDSQELLR